MIKFPERVWEYVGDTMSSRPATPEDIARRKEIAKILHLSSEERKRLAID